MSYSAHPIRNSRAGKALSREPDCCPRRPTRGRAYSSRPFHPSIQHTLTPHPPTNHRMAKRKTQNSKQTQPQNDDSAEVDVDLNVNVDDGTEQAEDAGDEVKQDEEVKEEEETAAAAAPASKRQKSTGGGGRGKKAKQQEKDPKEAEDKDDDDEPTTSTTAVAGPSRASTREKKKKGVAEDFEVDDGKAKPHNFSVSAVRSAECAVEVSLRLTFRVSLPIFTG